MKKSLLVIGDVSLETLNQKFNIMIQIGEEMPNFKLID